MVLVYKEIIPPEVYKTLITRLNVCCYRLYASPTFKVNENNMGLSKLVLDFQRSTIEEIVNARLNESCHLEECNENNDSNEPNGNIPNVNTN